MRELGEGMRRIFELMRNSELAPPEIASDTNSFNLTLHHRPMYSRDEALWLEQYEQFKLSAEEKAVLLMGRRGDLIAPNDIIRRLGIVDTEHYRQVVHSLQTKEVLETAIPKAKAQSIARGKRVSARDIPRFKVKPTKDIKPKAEPPAKVVSSAKIVEDIDRGDLKALYVGNIPPNTSKRDLADALKECGSLAMAFIPKAGGLSKGYAFVAFKDVEAAQRALQANLHLGGRRLVIRWKRPRMTKTNENLSPTRSP
jgi:ATP-dependent DNA helicase RecG